MHNQYNKQGSGSVIIHTGLRTDIPAFYSTWFLNRLRDGYVMVRNPYDVSSVTRYDLSPRLVDLIIFCTKNPAPMLPAMDVLKRYSQYWFVTITPYGREIEPNVPPKERVLKDFQRLSQIVGVDAVAWRYDPIFISGSYSMEQHLAEFETMAKMLCGYTKTCVISFIDLYQKVRRNFPEVREVMQQERIQIGKAFVQIGKKYGMTIKSCAEGDALKPYGVDCDGCMTLKTFERTLHKQFCIPHYEAGRSACTCYLSCDIGQYDTCGHFCRYCYANSSEAAVHRNISQHDPKSAFLIGNSQSGDRIQPARQESWLDLQLNLFYE